MTSEAMQDAQIRDAVARGELHVLRADAPVSEWSIRAWCGAMGDLNPVYLDFEAAKRAGYESTIAPPVMMHSYTLPTLLNPESTSPAKRLRQRFAAHGFTSVVAVDYEQTYLTPIKIGDLLKRAVSISAISGEKTTTLGAGHFVTTSHRVTNQRNELIGTLLVKVFYFRPRDNHDPVRIPSKTPVTGDEIPATATILTPLEIPVTSTLIVAGALASSDFEPVHHDKDYAQRAGLPDIIMNILTSSGLAARFVTDWTGPTSVLKKLALRLQAPNCPGDTLRLSGWATPQPDGDTCVKVSGQNSKGSHLVAELTVCLRA